MIWRTIIRLGDYVRPHEDTIVTIRAGGAVWGWGSRNVGRVRALGNDDLLIDLPSRKVGGPCPPGWGSPIVTCKVAWADVSKLRPFHFS